MGDLAGTSHEVRPRQVQSPGRDLSSIARGQRSTIGAERQAGDALEATGHQRRANVRGAFAVTRPESIQGQTVLVVDDVMTTGTTAGECARVLLRAGAKQVFVATVARATREVEIRLDEQSAWAKTAHA